MHPLLIVLICIGGFFALLALLILFGSAKVRISYRTKPRVVVSVLGIPFTVLSDKEPEGAKTDLSRCRNPQRVLRRELKRQKRLAAKAEKKRQKAALKAAEKAKRKKEKKAQAAKVPSPNLKENLDMILALLKRLYRVTRGKIGIHVKRLSVSVGTDDAAKTAILYGVAVSGIASITEFIERSFTHVKHKKGDMQVGVDYTSGKTRAEIDIICSIRFFRALGIGIKMLFAWRRERAKALRRARERKIRQIREQQSQTAS